MKPIVWMLIFSLLVSLSYATDVYFIADNAGDPMDVVLMMQLTSVVPPRVYSVHSKMSDEVSSDTLRVSCLNVFIFKGDASVIVGSPNCDNLAQDIVNYLENKNVPVTLYDARDVAFNDLRSTLVDPTPNCIEEENVTIYGDVEFFNECIDDYTLYVYSCVDDALVEEKLPCTYGCVDNLCLTEAPIVKNTPPKKEDTDSVIIVTNKTDDNTTENVDVGTEEFKEGFLTRLVDWFTGFFS